jgi:hypothetical protein
MTLLALIAAIQAASTWRLKWRKGVSLQDRSEHCDRRLGR